MTLDFTLSAGRYAIARLGPESEVPPWATSRGFFSVTRTSDELSIICEESLVPPGVVAATGWKLLGIAGPLPFSAIGIAAEFTGILARSGISVIVLSTYDTDYLLLQEDAVVIAIAALRSAGHRVSV